MKDKVNLVEKFSLLDAPYHPGIIGYLNDYKLQIVKIKGPFMWHRHDDTDDFFLVIEGRLTIHLRDRDIELGPGELYVVPTHSYPVHHGETRSRSACKPEKCCAALAPSTSEGGISR